MANDSVIKDFGLDEEQSSQPINNDQGGKQNE